MKIAIVCAEGIGDALITSIAAHALRKAGHNVTIFSPHLQSFGKFLEEGNYLPLSPNWEETLSSFDATLLQHEDSKKAKEIFLLRKKNLIIYTIYTNYRTSKHGPLLPGYDYPVDETKPMAYNICKAMRDLFNLKTNGQNSLLPTLPLIHRKYEQRILIHPMSMQEDKNWVKSKFLKLGKKLKEKGMDPLFILSPKERPFWPGTIHAPHFATLAELTETVYESGFLIGNDSGPAHLASYYSIPHIVIAQGRQMPLWSTGWYPPMIVRPARWVPNLKGMRLREKKWKHFITTRQVLKEFENLWEQAKQHPPSPLDRQILGDESGAKGGLQQFSNESVLHTADRSK